MKKRIKKFSIHQTSKVLAIVHWVLFAVIGIPAGFIFLLTGAKDIGAGIFIALLFYLVFFYGMALAWVLIYNFVASTFGGIEFTLSDEEKPNP